MSDEVKEEKELTPDEKIEATLKKTEDFWARNNIGTRFSLIVFILGYVGAFFTSYIYDTPQWVLETSGWLLFSAFITVTLGINGLSKVADIVTAMKSKPKV